jgi:hypothetical protein
MGDRQDLIRHHTLQSDDAFGDPIELLQRLRIVDVAVLDLEDHRQDVRAAEHAPEIGVDLDVRIGPRPHDRWQDAADRAFSLLAAIAVCVGEGAELRVEVEEVGVQAHLGERKPEHRSQEDDRDRDATAVAQQEAQVGFDPSLRNHTEHLRCGALMTVLSSARETGHRW